MIKTNLITFSFLMLFTFSGDGPYKDGKFSGSSRAIYTNEPYFGFSNLTIENGKIVKAEFFIRDSVKHEYLDERYEKHFAGNDEYINQCRNDCRGMRSYPDSLLKYQDLDKVDVISGATWSYNIFKASIQKALKAASK